MKALIAGAGIGGLTAAIALKQVGWDIAVYEQAPSLSQIGAGVQISPNGIKILQNLGVMPYLEDSLYEPDSIQMRLGTSGRQIFSLPMKKVATKRWGARYIQVHRADLVAALQARLEELAGDVIHFDRQITGYTDTGLSFQGGQVALGNLVIAADGIHSVLRAQMHGADDPRYTGNYAWRAVVPKDKLPAHKPPLGGCIWAMEGKHAVTTWVKGGEMVNFVGIVESTEWSEESWNALGQRSDALADFKDAHRDLKSVLEAAGNIHKWALLDRAPLPFWSQGNVALLGDAAHPMLPSMAQGAVQAMEDAMVLANRVSQTKDIEKALKSYFADRIKRTSAIQTSSLSNLNLFHKSGFERIIAYVPIWVAARLVPILLTKRNDWIYGWEP